MATVIVNLIGDDINIDAKLAVSFKVNATFDSEVARLKQKVGNDLKGVALYRCEGDKPDVRPTLPMSWKSTPGKERLKRGDFVYLKVADLTQQRRDTEFHEALLEFRRSRGYAGPLPNLRDVTEFRDELTTKLNAVAVRDVSTFEAERRAAIEAEEFRDNRDITIGIREKYELQERETRGRRQIEADFRASVEVAYQRLIVEPRLTAALAQLDGRQSSSRSVILEEDATQRAQFEKEFRRVAESLEQKARRQGTGSGGSTTAVVSSEVIEALRSIEERLQQQSVASETMLKALMQAQNDALEGLLLIRRRDEEDILARHRGRMSQLEHAAEANRSNIMPTDAEGIEHMKALLKDQNAILSAMLSMDDRDDRRHASVADSTLKSTIAGAITGIIKMQELLVAQQQMVLSGGANTANQKRTSTGDVERTSSSASCTDGCWRVAGGGGTAERLGQRLEIRRVLAAAVRKHALHVRFGYTNPMDMVEALMGRCRGSAWGAADSVVAFAGISTSALWNSGTFRRLARLCDAHAPVYRCVLTLLIDLYAGREAELGAALLHSGLGLGGEEEPHMPALPTATYRTLCDPLTGEQLFEHTLVEGVTQRLRPRDYPDGAVYT